MVRSQSNTGQQSGQILLPLPLARGDLRELKIRQMRIERRLYLVYRQDRPLTGAAQALVDIILSRKKPSARRKVAPQES